MSYKRNFPTVEKRLNHRSLRWIKKYLLLNPNNVELFEYFSTRLRKEKKYLESIEVSEKGLEINPKSKQLIFNLISSFLETDQIDKAVDLTTSETLKNEESIEYLLLLTKMNIYLKNFENAKFFINKAIQKEPNIGKVYYYQGVLFLSIGKNKDAYASFSKAYQCQKKILYFVALSESYIRSHSRLCGMLYLAAYLLPFLLPAPFWYYFLSFYCIIGIWDILSAVVLQNKNRVKTALLLVLSYPVFLYIFRQIIQYFFQTHTD